MSFERLSRRQLSIVITLLAGGLIQAIDLRGEGAFTKSVVAKSGDFSLRHIGSAVAINDRGTVAFIGDIGADEPTAALSSHVFASRLNTDLEDLSISENSPEGILFGEGIIIANDDGILVRAIELAPGDPSIEHGTHSLQAFYPATSAPPIEVLEARQATLDWAGFFPYPAANNPGSLLFTGFKSDGTPQLGVLTSQTALLIGLTDPTVRPVLADNDTFFFATGTTSRRLRWFDANGLHLLALIADTPSGFKDLGKVPGLSDDGTVGAFYADLDDTAAASLNTNPGPGIFLVVAPEDIRTSSTPPVVARLTGWTHTRDKAAPVHDSELGLQTDPSTAPLFLASYAGEAPIRIQRHASGRPGWVDDVIVVVFQATPNRPEPRLGVTGGEALWSMSVEVSQAEFPKVDRRIRTTRPRPIVQVGDDSAGGTVRSFAHQDPLALPTMDSQGNAVAAQTGAHWVAYSAQTDQQVEVVRATYAGEDIAFIPRSACDPAWGEQPYGATGKSFCDAAGRLTTVCMAISHYGYELTPTDAAAKLKTVPGLFEGGDIPLDLMVRVLTDNQVSVEPSTLRTSLNHSNPEAAAFLHQTLRNDRAPILVGVDFQGTPYAHRMLLVNGSLGEDFLIADALPSERYRLSEWEEYEVQGVLRPVLPTSDGSPSIVVVPRVNLLDLYWPDSSKQLILESSSSLTQPQWELVSEVDHINGIGHVKVPLRVSGSQFFRLR